MRGYNRFGRNNMFRAHEPPSFPVVMFGVLMVFGLILVLGMNFVGCTDDSEAINALETMGFSHPQITSRGWNAQWHGCSKGDGAYYEVLADNPAGKRVSLVVCCGGPMQWKGCTVRTR